jgi:DNA-binding MarR family transcriptional regulator
VEAVPAPPDATGLSFAADPEPAFTAEPEPVFAPLAPPPSPPIADLGAQAAEIARLFPVVALGPRPLTAILDQDGVTPRMLALMRHLTDGPATVSEQAQALGASRGVVADIVARLEIWELARRARDDRDGRRVLVHLTEEGRALLSGASDTVDPRALEGLLSQLDPGAREGLLAGLRALAALAAPRPR